MLSSEKLARYRRVVASVFGLSDAQEIDELQYQGLKQWDSLGHMALMAALEDEFTIELDIDDIIDFSSIEVGREILSKYELR